MTFDLMFTIQGKPLTSTNRNKIVKMGKRYGVMKSDAAIAYQEDAVWQLVNQRNKSQHTTITQPFAVELHIYRKKNQGDVDNYSKAIFDAMQQARIMTNDSLIYRMAVEKFVDKDDPRVEIYIRKPEAEQGTLFPL